MEFRSSDIIIAVMGITGSGKSTFISRLVNQDVLVGHGLTSMTATVAAYSFSHPIHGTIYLIDTPGFDDTFTSDTDILKNIAAFLSGAYRGGTQLTGIVYMHPINHNRINGSSLRNINIFKQLCGNDAYKHVVLSTSMWGKDDYSTCVNRESELKDKNGFWGLMHSRGSPIMRWDNDQASALRIVSHLLKGRVENGPTTFQIQRELVDEKRELECTSAGQQVNKDLIEAKKKWAADIEQLKADHQQAMKECDPALADMLRKQVNDLQEKLQKATKMQEELNARNKKDQNLQRIILPLVGVGVIVLGAAFFDPTTVAHGSTLVLGGFGL